MPPIYGDFHKFRTARKSLFYKSLMFSLAFW